MRAGHGWGAAAWVLPATGAAAVAWAAVAPIRGELTGAQVAKEPAPFRATPYRADSLARQTVLHDVFRADRRPAAVSYDPVRAGLPPPEPPPKPQIVLTGIVWGAVPEAVVEGLPGISEPRVVRAGDVIGDLQIRHITRDRVVVAGMDTVWTLTVRQPWR